MTLIIVLNAGFAASVVVGIVGLHLYAIAKDHSEHSRIAVAGIATESVAVALARDPAVALARDPAVALARDPAVAPARDGNARRRVARRELGSVTVRPEPASGQALF
jgi:hypothetical protein